MQDNDQRSNITKDKWLLILVIIIVIFLLFSNFGEQRGRIYDCGMAEWHPDIPPAVKEECRRRALEYWREQQEKINREKTTV